MERESSTKVVPSDCREKRNCLVLSLATWLDVVAGLPGQVRGSRLCARLALNVMSTMSSEVGGEASVEFILLCRANCQLLTCKVTPTQRFLI